MPRRRRSSALILMVPLLAACFTGERPHLEDDPEQTLSTAPSGDPNIDAVLERLDRVDEATFTAHLHVLTRRDGIETDVVVTQAGPERRSVTIGDVRYMRSNGHEFTCDLVTESCSSGINEARVSDLQLTSRFFSSGAAARLRQDARTKISSSVPSTEVFADQTATCVAVPVSQTTRSYCALDSGMLASLDHSDIAVTLTSYVPTVDDDLFIGPA